MSKIYAVTISYKGNYYLDVLLREKPHWMIRSSILHAEHLRHTLGIL